jgi:hypothetical protein
MSTDIATRNPNAIATLPDFIKKGDTRGTENIGNDIKFPALKLAQSMTPEAKRTESAYIDGLREGDLFNSITREIYGEDPVRFIIVNSLGHRFVEFDPEDGKVVLDGNVPDGDPRTEFTEEERDGKKVRVKPRATKFIDYLIMLLHDGDRKPELMTLSLKSTQLKKATQLNTILKLADLPSFAFVIKGTPGPEKGKKGNYFGWQFSPAGWPSEALYNAAANYYEEFKGKEVKPADTDAPDDAKEESGIPF